MCQNPWLVHSGWIISNLKCLLSSTPAHSIPSCFANVKGADTCFDFDLVNRNCSSGRSWSRSGQQGDVARFPHQPTFIWVSLYFQLFLQSLWEQLHMQAVRVPARPGRAGPGTLLSGLHKMSPCSLIKIEVPYCQQALVISEVGRITVCVNCWSAQGLFHWRHFKIYPLFMCSWQLFTAALVIAQGGSASPVQKAVSLMYSPSWTWFSSIPSCSPIPTVTSKITRDCSLVQLIIPPPLPQG